MFLKWMMQGAVFNYSNPFSRKITSSRLNYIRAAWHILYKCLCNKSAWFAHVLLVKWYSGNSAWTERSSFPIGNTVWKCICCVQYLTSFVRRSENLGIAKSETAEKQAVFLTISLISYTTRLTLYSFSAMHSSCFHFRTNLVCMKLFFLCLCKLS